ncbi:hypothetical protein G9A89_016931 [Geosiphon pyriformis]|nr:hypothetical protein G9A89_016931 [Geosiphon pyriformis]
MTLTQPIQPRIYKNYNYNDSRNIYELFNFHEQYYYNKDNDNDNGNDKNNVSNKIKFNNRDKCPKPWNISFDIIHLQININLSDVNFNI